MHNENYKIIIKEIKEHNNWKDISCSLIRRINIVKTSMLPKAINAIPTNIPMAFLTEIKKKSYNLHGTTKDSK